MKRRLFKLAAVVSLGMMLAVVALWVRSYYCTDHLRWDALDCWELESGRGSLVLSWSSMTGGAPFHWSDEPDVVTYDLDYPSWYSVVVQRDVRLAGFGHARYFSGTLPVDHALYFMPHWFAATVFALPSIVWLIRARKMTRSNNSCQHCGYDLRATPDRCPECGMAVAPKPAEAAA